MNRNKLLPDDQSKSDDFSPELGVLSVYCHGTPTRGDR
jgi:hypothetical protein